MQQSRSLFVLLLSLSAVPAACDAGQSDASDSGGEGGTAGIEGTSCAFGDDPSKCGSADAFACTPELVPTESGCDEDDDCGTGELCFTRADAAEGEPPGICQAIEGVCSSLPPVGQGLAFGEACDPTASLDPCAGECVVIGDEGVGECEQTCRLGAESGCGQDTDPSAACAFFAYDLSDAGFEQGAGDLGVCAHFCNCNAECPGEQLCLSAGLDGWNGICAGGIGIEDSVPVCAEGAGGAGGSSG